VTGTSAPFDRNCESVDGSTGRRHRLSDSRAAGRPPTTAFRVKLQHGSRPFRPEPGVAIRDAGDSFDHQTAAIARYRNGDIPMPKIIFVPARFGRADGAFGPTPPMHWSMT
jgi:hypothetical protein